MTTYSDDETNRRPETDPVRVVPVDPGEPITMVVINAVADTLGCSPLELDPLSTQIDPDALDSLINGPVGRRDRLTVSFTFAGLSVAVTRTQIRLYPSSSSNNT